MKKRRKLVANQVCGGNSKLPESNCFLKGHRAPELASGFLRKALNEQTAESSGTIMALAAGLPDADAKVLQDDWHAAKDPRPPLLS